MNTLSDRRKQTRIELESINGFFRQCDVAASTGGNLDITILNISTEGMKFMTNSSCDSNRIKRDDVLFFRGCIFNDRIGFLSSQKAVAVWQEDTVFGVKFIPSLDLDEPSLIDMLK
ncbi:pilus assembly protein PilZ [Desulfovibrio sp. JC022]|uniref:pilus assembly protein PilZ n=1 Tax=Desulfovibrio sp. JC022 TaxID=2593642 RepID=UPI0013D092CB|nr:pilus assembly protein PilZ [Desulfovibrio sp. JC022]NDV21259.1 pilus assembly protein PilZ [Desulfovibrio sp. JC022]